MAMSASFFIKMFSPTLHNTGVGRRRSRREGAFAGDRPDAGGAQREGTEKAWPLPFRAGSYPLGVQSENPLRRWSCGGVVTLLDRWAAVNTKHVPKTEVGPGKT